MVVHRLTRLPYRSKVWIGFGLGAGALQATSEQSATESHTARRRAEAAVGVQRSTATGR